MIVVARGDRLGEPVNKEKVVAEIRNIFRKKFPTVAESAACLYLSICAHFWLKIKYGVDSIFQAGTCKWPRLEGEEDNSVFGYVWEPHSLDTMYALIADYLPEIHVWLYLTATEEFLDLTTGDFPIQCFKSTRLDWPGTKPPPFLWGTKDQIPEGVSYIADADAVDLVHVLVRRVMERLV